MMDKIVVSVIIPTRNSQGTLGDCLRSIQEQSYPDIETIVVDNNSTDSTIEIAREYTGKVFSQGWERSAQRNCGVRESEGKYVLIIDSDMILSQDVIASCLKKISEDKELMAIIIPEQSFGEGFWAQCKILERSFYVGVDWMEAARFFYKADFERVGGYNENMVGPEDWDLSQRIAKIGKLDRVDKLIFHNEGKLLLSKTIKKKYYYADKFLEYLKTNEKEPNVRYQTGIIARYKLFLSKPGQLFKNPFYGVGMLFMKTCEFGAGGFGHIKNKLTMGKQ